MTDERIAELMGWRWPTSVHPDDMLAKVRAVVHTAVSEAKQEWQGLTDDEIEEFEYEALGTHDLCLEIEAKLQEKNT